MLLTVKQLAVELEHKVILHNLDLTVEANEVCALMGKNGSGKSTLAQTLMGNSVYKVTQGSVLFNGKTILAMDPTQRAQEGIFLSFQSPSEISGVSVASYLRMVYSKKTGTPISPIKFRAYLKDKLDLLGMPETFLSRSLNEGFSGGEKKKMEMLQMLVLEPKLAILDEVDSGLDIDAVKTVSKAVNYLKEKTHMAVLIITHYPRILTYIKPDVVHILHEGNIVKSGDMDLVHALEEKGYSNL